MTAFSLGEFAAHLLTMEADVKLAEEAAVVSGCKLIQRKAKGMLGHEQPFWQGLKPETIARKAHGNTPLLETGEMKASIEMTAPLNENGEIVGYVGSNSIIAVYQELGTSRGIPPRPFISTAGMANGHLVAEMAGKLVYAAMIHGGSNFHTALRVFHMLEDAGKKLLDEFGPEDEDEGKRK
jgi:hypothetical protein